MKGTKEAVRYLVLMSHTNRSKEQARVHGVSEKDGGRCGANFSALAR